MEQDDFIGVRCQESDAPPSELEDIDPEVHLKHKEYVIRSNKNTLSSTQTKVLGRHEVDHGKNLGQNALVSQKVSSMKRSTVQKPRMYKFVHSNGDVDVVTI